MTSHFTELHAKQDNGPSQGNGWTFTRCLIIMLKALLSITAATLQVINMSGKESMPDQSSTYPGWRMKLGSALFLLSIILPLAGVSLAASIGMSATMTASVSGMLLIASEFLGVIAVAVLGKSGYVYIKSRVFGFLKQYAPPGKVSRLRYTIGLVMFSVPILFGWAAPYAAELFPDLPRGELFWALGGDLLFLTSLFVLGGDFWDKLRALFVYDAEVSFTKS